MSLGIFLHLINAINFRYWANVFGEFIPQILFLWCIFGYMVSLIVKKKKQEFFSFEIIPFFVKVFHYFLQMVYCFPGSVNCAPSTERYD